MAWCHFAVSFTTLSCVSVLALRLSYSGLLWILTDAGSSEQGKVTVLSEHVFEKGLRRLMTILVVGVAGIKYLVLKNPNSSVESV